jgi:predicted phage tail protein
MALTKVILDGPLGKAFGKEWNLAVTTPNQALALIEANKPGIQGWIRNNADKFSCYRVTITDKRGKKHRIDDSTYQLQRDEQPAMIRFTPVVSGSSAGIRTVVGAILIAVGLYFGQPWLVAMGASLMIGGLVELLSPRPKKQNNTSDDGASYYFNGPVNTTAQGVPVPLVYGRCLVGSQAVSASVTIDQLMG